MCPATAIDLMELFHFGCIGICMEVHCIETACAPLFCSLVFGLTMPPSLPSSVASLDPLLFTSHSMAHSILRRRAVSARAAHGWRCPAHAVTTTTTRHLATSPSPIPSDLYRSPMRDSNDDDDTGPLSSHATVINPTQQHRSTVVWLHGLGEPVGGMLPAFRTLRLPHTRLVVPRAPKLPITALDEDEERCWFDVKEERMYDGMEEDEGGMDDMGAQIEELLADEERLVASPSHIVLAGTAHGAAMAAHVALARPTNRQLAALVAISGYLPLPHRYPQRLGEGGRRTAVLALHGKGDRVIPWEWARQGWERLRVLGVPVEQRADQWMSAQLSMEQFTHTFMWINDVLSKQQQQFKT